MADDSQFDFSGLLPTVEQGLQSTLNGIGKVRDYVGAPGVPYEQKLAQTNTNLLQPYMSNQAAQQEGTAISQAAQSAGMNIGGGLGNTGHTVIDLAQETAQPIKINQIDSFLENNPNASRIDEETIAASRIAHPSIRLPLLIKATKEELPDLTHIIVPSHILEHAPGPSILEKGNYYSALLTYIRSKLNGRYPQSQKNYAEGGGVFGDNYDFSGLSGSPTSSDNASAGAGTSTADLPTQKVDGYDISGLSVLDPQKAAETSLEARYGTIPQQALAAIEGGAQGVIGPIAPGLEIASGLTTGKDIRGRAEVNPWTHGLSEAGSFAASSVFGDELGLSGIVGEVGEGAQAIAPEVAGVKTAAELATLQASNELSKMIEGDPNQTLGSAAINIGLSGVIGGLGGNLVSRFNPIKSFARRAFNSKAQEMIANILGEGGALAAGIGLGNMFGWPILGGFVAERTLAPIFTALAKPFAEKIVDSAAAEAAFEYTYTAQAGKRALMNNIADLFGAGAKTIQAKDYIFPSSSVRNELIKALQGAQDPNNALQIGNNIAHYLPNHASGAGMLTAQAINYFNSLKPQEVTSHPLDTPAPIDKNVEANYNRQLDNAQQPLMILQHIRNGSLNIQDKNTIQTLFPGLHDQMIKGITNQIIQNKEKAQALTYSVKNSINLLLGGNPIDGTMGPNAAQAIIRSQGNQQSQTQQQTGQKPRQRKPSGSVLNQLNKVDSLYQTRDQAREADKRQ